MTFRARYNLYLASALCALGIICIAWGASTEGTAQALLAAVGGTLLGVAVGNAFALIKHFDLMEELPAAIRDAASQRTNERAFLRARKGLYHHYYITCAEGKRAWSRMTLDFTREPDSEELRCDYQISDPGKAKSKYTMVGKAVGRSLLLYHDAGGDTQSSHICLFPFFGEQWSSTTLGFVFHYNWDMLPEFSVSFISRGRLFGEEADGLLDASAGAKADQKARAMLAATPFAMSAASGPSRAKDEQEAQAQ